MRPHPILRLAARLTVIGVVLVVLAVAGTQYAHILGRNVALARELGDVRSDVARLERERARKEAQIKRLADPAGAVPEIHEELRLVGDREAIIYLKGRDGGRRER